MDPIVDVVKLWDRRFLVLKDVDIRPGPLVISRI